MYCPWTVKENKGFFESPSPHAPPLKGGENYGWFPQKSLKNESYKAD